MSLVKRLAGRFNTNAVGGLTPSGVVNLTDKFLDDVL
jgi:hypothetical protein